MLNVLGQSELCLVLEGRDGSLVTKLTLIVAVALDRGLQQQDGSETGILCSIDVHLLKLGDGVLKILELAQQSNGRGGVVNQCCHFNWKIELRGAENEELPPGLFQEKELVSVGQRGEGRDVLGPPDIHEEQSGSSFRNVFP